MKKQHRVLSLLLAMVMALSLLPSTALAADTAVSTDADSPVQIRKWAEENSDGTYTLSMEAYVTGSVQQGDPDPLDIVLVLDQSGSMAYDFNGDSTKNNRLRRQYAMKNAVRNFIDAVGENSSANRIALVTFAYDASVLANWTQVDRNGIQTLKNAIGDLPDLPSGATNIGAGMELAESLMENAISGRDTVVIAFTDGVPTTSTAFSTAVADDAIAASKNMKDAGVTIYSVGIFTGANPDELYGEKGEFDETGNNEGEIGYYWKDTSWFDGGDGVTNVSIPAGNRFLNYISSNAPSASSLGLKRDSFDFVYHYEQFEITSNYSKTSDNYYLTASDAGSLDSVFGDIAETIVPGVSAGADTVLADTLTDAFDFVIGAYGAADISVYESSASGSGYAPVWGAATASSATAEIQGKTISISGFDYASNAVVNNGGSWTGKKLIVRFAIAPDPDAQWQSGTHDYDTNNTTNSKAGLYDSTGSALDALNDSPSVPVSAYDVRYSWTNAPADVTLPTGESGILGGASHTVDTTYTDETSINDYDTYGNIIGKWTFSGWDKSGTVTVTENLTISGSWEYEDVTPTEYTVSYRFTSTDNPDGIALPDDAAYVPGTPVEIHDGYTSIPVYDSTNTCVIGTWSFSGWNRTEDFNMPAEDVEITGSWSYTDAETYSVSYSWTNAPESVTLPTGESGLYSGASHAVDTTYSAGHTVNKFDTYGNIIGIWTFSGWDKSGAITVTENLTISGTWEYDETTSTEYTVSYSFTSTDNPDGVILPDDAAYVPGAPVEVHDGYADIDVLDSTNTYVVGTWTFSGWNRTEDFNMPAENVEITGSWSYTEAETYTVSYHLVGDTAPEGWTLPTDSKVYYAGQQLDVIAQSNIHESNGYYTFDGWYTDEAMTIAAGASIAMPAGGLHLYGSWRWVQTIVPTTSFSFLKVNNFGMALNGARFGLYSDSACKNLISTAVSLSQGSGMQAAKGIVSFDNIPVKDATYYLKEISAPNGYVTSDEVYEVRVRAIDQESIDVRVRLLGSNSWTTLSRLRIVNMPVEPETGSIRISKEISGKIYSVGNKQFVFNIYDAWGELADATQMTAGQTKVVNLEPGVYTITEANPSLSGYSVKTYINGSKQPGVSISVRVEEGKIVDVDYENVYDLDINLNTEDHYGYIVGYPDGTVGPNNAITRAEVATIFFRMLTDDAREYYYSISNSFTDVKSTDWFNVAVSTLSNAGVLTGYEDGSFQPGRPITRAELVTIAMSFFDFAQENSEELFSDVAGHWADAAINFAAQLGIVTGYGDGSFAPDKTITRAETITIINRVLYRAPHDDHLLPQMVTWSDNRPGTWYYAQVQEATNSHTYSWTVVNGARYEDWDEILPIRDWAAIERAWTRAYLAGEYGEVMNP